MKISAVTRDFEALAGEIETQFKKKKISQKEVEEAVRWARRG